MMKPLVEPRASWGAILFPAHKCVVTRPGRERAAGTRPGPPPGPPHAGAPLGPRAHLWPHAVAGLNFARYLATFAQPAAAPIKRRATRAANLAPARAHSRPRRDNRKIKIAFGAASLADPAGRPAAGERIKTGYSSPATLLDWLAGWPASPQPDRIRRALVAGAGVRAGPRRGEWARRPAPKVAPTSICAIGPKPNGLAGRLLTRRPEQVAPEQTRTARPDLAPANCCPARPRPAALTSASQSISGPALGGPAPSGGARVRNLHSAGPGRAANGRPPARPPGVAPKT